MSHIKIHNSKRQELISRLHNKITRKELTILCKQLMEKFNLAKCEDDEGDILKNLITTMGVLTIILEDEFNVEIDEEDLHRFLIASQTEIFYDTVSTRLAFAVIDIPFCKSIFTKCLYTMEQFIDVFGITE